MEFRVVFVLSICNIEKLIILAKVNKYFVQISQKLLEKHTLGNGKIPAY